MKKFSIAIILSILCYIIGITNSFAIEDTRLQSLTITPEGTGLSPAFSADIYQYHMTVENEVTNVEIKALANQPSNRIEITGGDNLEEGSNLVKIKVMATNGESSSYSIFVTRKSPEIGKMEIVPNVIEEKSNKPLQVTGIILDEASNLFIHPQYNPEVHDYTLELKGDATSIPLTVVANYPEANIEIQGNENLVDGKNTIKIKVRKEEEILNYKILVYKNIPYPQAVESKPVLIQEQKDKATILIFLAIILIIAVIGILKIRIDKIRKQNGKNKKKGR